MSLVCKFCEWGIFLFVFLITFPLFSSNEIINTVAGTGTAGYTGDTGLATACTLRGPQSVILDSSNNIFLADTGNNVVRKIDHTTLDITTIAGTGTAGYSGDAALAILAELSAPCEMCFDGSGDLYICDSANNRIRKITMLTGIITTYAGTGTAGHSGDTDLATLAKLNAPKAICFDSAGNFYIADSGNSVIRKITASTGIITTFAGKGTPGYSGDSGLATAAQLRSPWGICFDSLDDLYIADTGNNAIRIVYSTGIINTYIGAYLSAPKGLSLDGAGNLYIGDTGNDIVHKVNTTLGTIAFWAGTLGASGYSGDAGLAVNAALNGPIGICCDSSNNLYIADTQNNVLRKVALGALPTPAPAPSAILGANQTSYISGIDQNDPTIARFDTIQIGASGNFTGYTAPQTNTNKIVLTLQPISGVAVGANSSATGHSILPSTLRELWINGDATGLDIACGSTSGYQLPTPSTYCDIHFALDKGSAIGCQWFQAALPSYCNIYVEPGSVDPNLTNLLGGLNGTNILVIGAPINLQTIGSLTCAAQRHPSIAVSRAHDLSLVTIEANTDFKAALHGLSISSGSYTCTFDKNSDIVDPQLTYNPPTSNFIISASVNFYLYGCNAPLPSYLATLLIGTNTQILPVTHEIPLLPIGPHPVIASQSVIIPPTYL